MTFVDKNERYRGRVQQHAGMSFPGWPVLGYVSLSATQWASKGADLKVITRLYGITCGQILYYLTHYLPGDHTYITILVRSSLS